MTLTLTVNGYTTPQTVKAGDKVYLNATSDGSDGILTGKTCTFVKEWRDENACIDQFIGVIADCYWTPDDDDVITDGRVYAWYKRDDGSFVTSNPVYITVEKTHCEITIFVLDTDLYPVKNAKVVLGGTTEYTDSNGKAEFILLCNQTYTATATPPENYNCDCGICYCKETFTPTDDGFITFTMECEIIEEYCQQDFHVKDQNNNPVRNATILVEDKTTGDSYVTGETDVSGNVATLHTITGHSYVFSINEYPSGYEEGEINEIGPITACTGLLTFEITRIETECEVQICVKDQNGIYIPGVTIDVSDYGEVVTKSGYGGDPYGCALPINLECDSTHTATIDIDSLPEEYNCYTGSECSKTFIVEDGLTINLKVIHEEVIEDFHISGPTEVVVGQPFDVDIVYASPNTDVYIKYEKSGATDPTIGTGTSDASGSATISCVIDDVGSYKIYGYTKSPMQKTENTLYITVGKVNCADHSSSKEDCEKYDCYWWSFNNTCHDEPFALKIYDTYADSLGGVSVFIDGVNQEITTPCTIDMESYNVGDTVEVFGVYGGILTSKKHSVKLKSGITKVTLNTMSDNIVIIGISAIAGTLLLKKLQQEV